MGIYLKGVEASPAVVMGVIPSGTKIITENGSNIDVSSYEKVDVNVPISVSKFKSLVDRSITTVTAEDLAGVTSIGTYAFYGCNSLTSVTIGNGVTSIGELAFYECYRLTSVTIGDSVTSIGERAFDGCSSLTSIVIPDSVTSIGERVFYGCYSLTSVTIPDSVTSIGGYAFYGCSKLTSVTIPDSVTSIGSSAFEHCSNLTSITIPDSVTSIGDRAFLYCRSLTSATIKATTPPTLGYYAFSNTNNCPIYVPAESVDAYKTATNWSTYASRIQAIPT